MVIWKSRPLAALVAATALCLGGTAQAGLVKNGDFENGDFLGWTGSGVLGDFGVDTLTPHSGSYAAFFAVGPGTIHQTLTTVAGKTYHIEFWLQNEDTTGSNSMEFNWNGGAAEMSLLNEAAFGYTKYEFLLDATGASTDISFSFTNVPAFWDLDDVSVSVPEPGSLALVGLAGVAAIFARRRRDSAVTE